MALFSRLYRQEGNVQRSGRLRLLPLVAVALLLFSATAVITLRSPRPARAASVPTGLHVVGNQIEDGSGHVLIPHGVDRMGGEYTCLNGTGNTFDGPTTQTVVNAMLTWDITIVRVPLNEDCWLGINGEPSGETSAKYQSDVVNWVNLLNANGILVILDLHWTNSGTNVASGQQPMADLDHAPAFWTSVANTFKSNSSVMFDLFNEPYISSGNSTNDWNCWENGSTAPNTLPCNTESFAVAGMQTLVNAVRSTGATNVLLLGGLAYSNDLSQWLTHEPSDPDHNLVASVHIYSNNACTTTSCWSSVKAQVPVLAGEIGEYDCADDFIDPLMSELDSLGIGYLAWTWNGYNCGSTPSLITTQDGTSGTPTAYRQGYMQHLIALAGGSVPTPTPTSASTPTPTPTPANTPTPAPTSTATPVSGVSCKVTYAITNQWPGGFGASLTITNTGTTTINGWSLLFTFPNGQTITQLWNGNYTQSGSNVTITNLSYNASIPPGQSLSSEPGFNGSWSGSNQAPTAFTLNGSACSTA
jgi:hypothetical protein